MDLVHDKKFYASNRADRPLVATADVPRRWATNAWWYDNGQSWDRPFRLKIMVAAHPGAIGPRFSVDTGEAFVWFEKASRAESLAQSSPVGGLFGLGMSGMLGGGFLGADPLMGAMAQMPVSVPETGRPERQFVSPTAYLDDLMRDWDDGFLGRGQIWLAGDHVIGESAQDAAARELRLAEAENREWAESGMRGGEVRIASALDRMVMRHWRLIDAQGQRVHLFIGARLKGFDMLCYPSGRAPGSLVGRFPFGHAPRGNALFHEVDWMAERRFYGVLVDGDWSVDEFGEMVTTLATTATFDKGLMSQMNRNYIGKVHEARERQGRRLEEARQANRDLDERLRQRDAERQERMRQHEEQLRIDRERRHAQDAQRDRDRRVRDAWGEAIRGTERYRDPYGHMVEMSVTGPNQRAFYDHRSGRTVMSDVTDIDKPSDWEELPRW